jgi:hypothetical protein
MVEGEPLPLEIEVGLIQRTMQYHISRGQYCFAIDSFPRQMDRAMAFENNVPPWVTPMSCERGGTWT